MKITKKFVQTYNSNDEEGRYFSWRDVNMSYEEAKKLLEKKGNGWFTRIREVEKIFDDETFMITEKPLRVYGQNWKTGKYEEKTGEELWYI